jgi:hypothetical protein
MISKKKVPFGLPALTMVSSEAFNLRVHRLYEPSKAFISSINVVTYALAFKLLTPLLFVTVERRHVPVIPEVHDHIRLVIHDGIRSSVDVSQVLVRAYLRVRDNQVASLG